MGAFFGFKIGGRGPDRAEAEARAARLLYACLERDLSFKVGAGTVATLCPPLTVDDGVFDETLEIVNRALLDVAST